MRRLLASPIFHALLVVALAFALFTPGLGLSGYAHAEAFRVQPAYEMLETGDLLVVRLFEQAYLRKPPGMPWAIALSTLTFGPGEFASRFVSAVAIAIGALASLLFIQRWFGKPFGLIAGLAFVLAPAFWWYPPIARSAEIEALHNTFVLAAALLILQTLLGRLHSYGNPRAWLRTLALALALTLALTGALLSKGPAGLPVVLAACIAGFALRRRDPIFAHAAARDWLAVFIAFAIAAASLAGWAWLANHRVHAADETVVLESPTLFLFQAKRLLGIALLPLEVLLAALPTSLGIIAIACYHRSILREPSTHAPLRIAQALALTAALSIAIFMLFGVGNNRYALPAIALFPAACGAGAWVLLRRARTFTTLARAHEHARLRRFAYVITPLLLAAAIFSAWYGEHRRNERTSGKSFGLQLGSYLTHDAQLWADQVIDTRPEVIMAAVNVAHAKGIHIRPRWMPISLWRTQSHETTVPLPPAGSFVLLRTDDQPRRDQYELDEEHEYAHYMPRLRHIHTGKVHNFEYQLFEVLALPASVSSPVMP